MPKKCETAYVLCNTTTPVITVPDEGVGTDDTCVGDNTCVGDDTEGRKTRAYSLLTCNKTKILRCINSILWLTSAVSSCIQFGHSSSPGPVSVVIPETVTS